jgi:GDPmannose 4,6-dehydratase
MARALITGVTGQDGVLLAELLLERGDTVIGTTRGDVLRARSALSAAASGVELRSLDLRDSAAVNAVIADVQPDEIYHLAAPAAPMLAWSAPADATDALCTAVARVIEAQLVHAPDARLVVASSAQIFGPDSVAPQSELTPRFPQTPYGTGKACALALVAAFRGGRGLHASGAILFNHESARRQSDYVTVKVCRAAVRIAEGVDRETPLRLGAIDVVRDWGHARDYMRALMLMAGANAPDDYVIGTGVGRTVGELCEVAFSRVGLDWRKHVVSEAAFARHGDVTRLVADPRRAFERLGWRPTVSFDELVDELLEAARRHQSAAPDAVG